MKLKVKRLDPKAKLPFRNGSMDAGYDLFSVESAVIKPNQTVKVRTGIAVQLEHDTTNLYSIQFKERGSVGSKGIGLRAGLVDEGYSGEFIVCLTNHNDSDYQVLSGDKVAQFTVQKVETPYIEEVDELEKTDRGEKAFGSSGR